VIETFCLCEGLTTENSCVVFCGPFSLVARNFIHLLARDLTYMVDL
jgi:hypothetical protein